MRLSFACLLVAGAWLPLARAVDTAPPREQRTPTQLPEAIAEPDLSIYGPPVRQIDSTPTEQDIGPVQKHFILATRLDSALEREHPVTIATLPREKQLPDSKVTIRKVHDVQNDFSIRVGGNEALRYELTYLNWGAVTQSQLLARRGHYFTVTWVNRGSRADFTARFQYRQVRSREVVRTLEQPITQAKGAVRSYFAVVNHAYEAYGPVSSWRLSILRGDQVVAETKSYIW